MSLDPIEERTTSRYIGQLVDETGAAIALASLTTFTLTLYDKATGQIINTRNAQNVLNANGVTVDVNGNVVWVLTPADTIIVSDAKAFEVHIALFQWTWSGGNKGGNHEAAITVRNLRMVS